MGCCDKQKSIEDVYIPINRRLMDFALQSTDQGILNKYPSTKLYVFTFSDDKRLCTECAEKFGDMLGWFTRYGILEDPVNNVKWIFEDEMDKNHISNDIGLSKSPTHLICDNMCNILDIVPGFPTPEWLEKHFLPMLRS